MSGPEFKPTLTGATGSLTYPDPELKTPVVTKPDDTAGDTPGNTGIPGDGLTKGKGATSQKATVEVTKEETTFPSKDEHPELYQKPGDTPTTTGTTTTETKPDPTVAKTDGTTETKTEGTTEQVPVTVDKTATTTDPTTPDKDKAGSTFLTGDKFRLSGIGDERMPRFQLTSSLPNPGLMASDLTLDGLSLGTKKYDKGGYKLKPPSISGFSGFELNLDLFLKDTAGLAARLSQFQYAATAKVEKKDVEKLEDAFAQAETALKGFDYLVKDPAVNKKSQAYKSYVGLQAIMDKVKDPSFAKLTESEKGELRKQLYDEINTFTKAMKAELKDFSEAWAQSKGGDPAFRKFINEQFAAMVYQAGLDDVKGGKSGTTQKKIVFNDANRAKWPPALQEAMATFEAKDVKDLQKKLGVKQDGEFGPQLFLAIQLNGLKKVQKGLDSVANDVNSDLMKTQAWMDKLKGLKANGLEATLQARPKVLETLAKMPATLPAGVDLSTLEGPELQKQMEALTGMDFKQHKWEMYTARDLYVKGFTVADGQLAHKDGSKASTADYAALTADLLDKQGTQIEKRFDILNAKAGDLDFKRKSRNVVSTLRTDIDELKKHPEKEPTTPGERTASVISRVNADLRNQTAKWLDQAMKGKLKVLDIDPNVLAIMKTVYKDRLTIDATGMITIEAEAEEKADVETLADMTDNDPEGLLVDLFSDAEVLHDVFAERGCGPFMTDLGVLLGLDPNIWQQLGIDPHNPSGLAGGDVHGPDDTHDGPIDEAGPDAGAASTGPSFYAVTTKDPKTKKGDVVDPVPVIAQDILTRWKIRLGPLDTDVVAEDRKVHAQKQADKLRAAARKEDEAYAAAVQKDGVEHHEVWRETVVVADTDVVDGKVLEKNATGSVIKADPATGATV